MTSGMLLLLVINVSGLVLTLWSLAGALKRELNNIRFELRRIADLAAKRAARHE